MLFRIPAAGGCGNDRRSGVHVKRSGIWEQMIRDLFYAQFAVERRKQKSYLERSWYIFRFSVRGAKKKR